MAGLGEHIALQVRQHPGDDRDDEGRTAGADRPVRLGDSLELVVGRSIGPLECRQRGMDLFDGFHFPHPAFGVASSCVAGSSVRVSQRMNGW